MRARFVSLLSLAAFLAVPSDAQTATGLPPQVDGRRIQNIQPEEMWTRVTQCVFPSYPELALASQITGTVAIGLCVSPRGEVANYRVLKGHPLLVNAAVIAIHQWKFQPSPGPGVVMCSRVRARFAWNAHHWPEQGVVLTEFLALRYAGVTCCCAPAVPFRASPGTGCNDASTAPPLAAWG